MDLGATVCRPARPSCPACPSTLVRGGRGSSRDGVRRRLRGVGHGSQGVERNGGPGERSARANDRPRHAAVSFEQTSRWLRGRIVDRLRDAPAGDAVTVDGPLGAHAAEAVAAAARGRWRATGSWSWTRPAGARPAGRGSPARPPHDDARRRLDPAALDAGLRRCAGPAGRRRDVPFAILAVADRRRPGPRSRRSPGRAPRPSTSTRSACWRRSRSRSSPRRSMQLVAEGQVALTDGIDRVHARSSPRRVGLEVTIWHLLTHTSGHPRLDLRQLLLDGVRRADLMRLVGGDATPLPAGEPLRVRKLVPSSSSPRCSSGSRGEHLRLRSGGRILEPLGMVDTTFDSVGASRRPGRAAGAVRPGCAGRGAGPWGQTPRHRRAHATSPALRWRVRVCSAPPATSSGSGGRCCAAASWMAPGSCRRAVRRRS